MKLLGKPLFHYVLANLNASRVQYFLVPYNEALTQYRFEDGLRHAFPNRRFIFLPCTVPSGRAPDGTTPSPKTGRGSSRPPPAPVLEAVLRILGVYEARVAARRA